MPEASSRVLLDRTALRLDGRPFLTIGAVLRETAAAELPAALAELAAAGFNTVAGPPITERNLWYAEALFEEAERHGHLVVAEAAPSLEDPAAFLGRKFKHRASLHSYRLPPPANEAALEAYCLQRDHLRTLDLFHPVWAPLGRDLDIARWAEAMDLHSVTQRAGGPKPRTGMDDGCAKLERILAAAAEENLQPRPLFCHSLQAGRLDEDPASPAAGAPEADLVRIRAWELFSMRCRGFLADSAEHLRAPQGRDRFCALAILAQEAAILHDFLAEGQIVYSEADTGHPRIRAGMLHHGDEVLVLLWRSATGDEYWIDDSIATRLELRLQLGAAEGLHAWRLDFPAARRVRIAPPHRGALRVEVGAVDLTAAVLLSRSSARAERLAVQMREALPAAANWAIQGLEARLSKIAATEGELSHLSTAHAPARHLEAGWRKLEESRQQFARGEHEACWTGIAEAQRGLRALVDSRMTEALSSARVERDSELDLLRRSYCNLPRFHREVARSLGARPALDFT